MSSSVAPQRFDISLRRILSTLVPISTVVPCPVVANRQAAFAPARFGYAPAPAPLLPSPDRAAESLPAAATLFGSRRSFVARRKRPLRTARPIPPFEFVEASLSPRSSRNLIPLSCNRPGWTRPSLPDPHFPIPRSEEGREGKECKSGGWRIL